MVARGETFPVYLVLTPFREIGPSVRVLLRALEPIVQHIPYAEGFYQDADDEALLGLQLDRKAVRRMGVPVVLDLIRRCNLPMIVPDELDSRRHQSFYAEHLSIYTTYVQQYRTPGPGEPLLTRVLTALEAHVTELPDAHYESVEVSSSSLPRASSKWEYATDADATDADATDADAGDNRRQRATKESDVRM